MVLYLTFAVERERATARKAVMREEREGVEREEAPITD